jgi:hypothetical protein
MNNMNKSKDMKQKNPVLKVNRLQNRYVTDANIWTVDETFFTENIWLFLVINLKTRAILGYILSHKPVTGNDIVELYSKILENYNADQRPLIVHSDLAPSGEYSSPAVTKFLKEIGHRIEISFAVGDQHQNQVSESVNDKIRALTILEILSKNNTGLRALVKTQPAHFKGKSNTSKSQSKEYREWFFESHFFQTKAYEAIENAVISYNSQDFSADMTRDEAEFLNTKIKGKTIEELHLVKSKDELANRIRKGNIEEFRNVESELTNILVDNTDVPHKLSRIENLLLAGQNSTHELLKLGFSGLAMQNSELHKELAGLQDQVAAMLEELTISKKQREDKEPTKRAASASQRKKKAHQEPMTPAIYEKIINSVEAKTYKASRLRVAFCLLALTGVRISELLPLKVAQLDTLLQHGWIFINRAKRGPSNHKAFLTAEGKRIVKERRKDLLKNPFYSQKRMILIFSLQKKILTVCWEPKESQ